MKVKLWFLKNIFKHGAFLPKQKHKSPNSFCLIRRPGPGRVRRLHKYHIWYFGPHFLNIGCWECPSKANNTILGYSIEKSGNNIANIIKKSHDFVRKTKYYQEKNSKWPWEITSRFLRGRERTKSRYTSLTLEKASSEKISSLQETLYLLNMCIGNENQGQSEPNKELKILGKYLKKLIKENKSLSLKLCKKN